MPTTALLTLIATKEFATALWADYNAENGRDNLAVMKCTACFEAWLIKGRKTDNRPPVFPPNYEGECPMCGGKMESGLTT